MAAAEDKTRRAIPWTRVGIMHDDHSCFKQILGISASSDGGIIVSPVKLAGVENWSYGRGRIPTGEGIGLPGGPDPASVLSVEQPPKLHYHQSGMVSVNLARRAERVSLKALPLRYLTGSQFFSFTLIRPDLLPTRAVRAGSLFGVVHDTWPAAVNCSGFAIERSRVRKSVLAQAQNAAVGVVADGGQPELVLDLKAYGLEVVVALRFTYDDVFYTDCDRVDCWLYGIDTKAVDVQSSCDVVGTWSNDEIVKAVAPTPAELRPFRSLDLSGMLDPIVLDSRHREPRPERTDLHSSGES